MKFGFLSLVLASTALLRKVSGTEVVGGVYFSNDVPLGDALNIEAKDYFNSLLKYTKEFCQNPGNKITYVVAENLVLDNSNSQPGATYPWVSYTNVEDAETVPIADNCDNVSVQVFGNVSLAKFIENSQSQFSEHNFVVVQQKPQFTITSEIDEAEVQEEQLVVGEFYWQSDISNDGNFKRTPSNSTTRGESVFTHYQFFTPGIISSLVLSSFLIFILYVAISWMASIEVTYLAFDKQIDYEKKTE